MTLTVEEVEHIANLARLEITPEEKSRFREQLSAILQYAARVNQIDTSDIPPTSRVIESASVLRFDQPRPGLDIAALEHNAPDMEERQFRVPPVLD